MSYRGYADGADESGYRDSRGYDYFTEPYRVPGYDSWMLDGTGMMALNEIIRPLVRFHDPLMHATSCGNFQFSRET